MLHWDNGGRTVESVDELPTFPALNDLYLDFETTSGDPREKSTNPWHHCDILGICVTADDAEGAWYVPVGHHAPGSRNLPRETVLRWLRNLMQRAKRWINHNVKYDALVSYIADVEPCHPMVCTLTLAKIIDSDRITKGGYGLDALSLHWLEEDISGYERRIKTYLAGCRSKDYGCVPVDFMAEYGCQDVLTTRKLFAYIDRRCPEQCRQVWDTEIKLTSCLYDMEVEGMHVDPQELLITQLKVMTGLLDMEEQLHQMTGMVIRAHVNDDCFELLCNKYGLPVLGWTDGGNPSFDKEALAGYLVHPVVAESQDLTSIVNLMLEYRKANTFNTMFLNPYITLQINGILHPSYNQAVRTGRMSCKQPNAQQLFDKPKMLVHPPRGYSFLSADYSQIEFRLIVHYLRNRAAIKAYIENPDTDFHSWVAAMCGIPRKPAKNVNFCIGFGGGRGKVTSMLASNMDLMGDLMKIVDERIASWDLQPEQRAEEFNRMCGRRADEVYEGYHANLPELKRVSRGMTGVAKNRGYVFNTHGRHRHLPDRIAHRAFNGVIQSSAADLMKERTVATSPRFNPEIRSLGIKQVGSVHDETLFTVPTEIDHDPEVITLIAREMEHTRVDLRVPIRVNIGASAESWHKAGSDDARVTIVRDW